jgi:hypothetical protein
MSTRRLRARALFAIVPACMLALALGARLRAQPRPQPAIPPPPALAEPAADDPAADEPAADDPAASATAEGPQRVYVGLYLHHVPELDIHSNSYLADFYLWFRWRGDIDPTESFEFTNLVEGWDVMRDVLYTDDEGNPRPDELPDGSRYQVLHVQSRFGHPFDVHDYPFDEQEIVILVEESDATPDALVYVLDEGADVVHETLEIPGWILDGVHAEVREARYRTNFGDTRRTPGQDSYTQLRYSLHVVRPVLGNLVMTVLPVTIVMMITLVIFLIDSKYFEGRLGLGITSLISAVALQLTASGDLPATGYMVLLDHIYNVSYLVIFLSLLESVVAVRLHDAGRPEAAQRLDMAALVALTLLFFGAVAAIVIFR